jgi:hypothetical protein
MALAGETQIVHRGQTQNVRQGETKKRTQDPLEALALGWLKKCLIKSNMAREHHQASTYKPTEKVCRLVLCNPFPVAWKELSELARGKRVKKTPT